MKMNYSDMFDCISDKSAEILNEYEEYELDTVFSAVNTEKVVISKIMNRVPSVKKKSLENSNTFPDFSFYHRVIDERVLISL